MLIHNTDLYWGKSLKHMVSNTEVHTQKFIKRFFSVINVTPWTRIFWVQRTVTYLRWLINNLRDSITLVFKLHFYCYLVFCHRKWFVGWMILQFYVWFYACGECNCDFDGLSGKSITNLTILLSGEILLLILFYRVYWQRSVALYCHPYVFFFPQYFLIHGENK